MVFALKGVERITLVYLIRPLNDRKSMKVVKIIVEYRFEENSGILHIENESDR